MHAGAASTLFPRAVEEEKANKEEIGDDSLDRVGVAEDAPGGMEEDEVDWADMCWWWVSSCVGFELLGKVVVNIAQAVHLWVVGPHTRVDLCHAVAILFSCSFVNQLTVYHQRSNLYPVHEELEEGNGVTDVSKDRAMPIQVQKMSHCHHTMQSERVRP